jgi:hypothetical protein
VTSAVAIGVPSTAPGSGGVLVSLAGGGFSSSTTGASSSAPEYDASSRDDHQAGDYALTVPQLQADRPSLRGDLDVAGLISDGPSTAGQPDAGPAAVSILGIARRRRS